MTSLFKKLNYKNHSSIAVLHAPISMDAELKEMSKITTIHTNIHQLSDIQFAMVFVTQLQEIEKSIEEIFPKLKDDAVLWYCYPKASSKKYRCEFNRDNGWASLGSYQLETVRSVAIDEDWTGLRFRKTEYIKTMNRNEKLAISENGKNRIKKNNNSNV